MVEMALLQKSNPGPMRLVSMPNPCTTTLILARTNSNTAKLTAPWGTLSKKLAPAPLESRLKLEGCKSDISDGGMRSLCRMVFMVFAGCMSVCAMEREMAPQTMFSQKTSGRDVMRAALAEDATLEHSTMVDFVDFRRRALSVWVKKDRSSRDDNARDLMWVSSSLSS